MLGKYLRQIGFFEPLERRVHLEQKVLKYTPIQKQEMLFVGLLSGIKAVSHTMTSVRVDVALTTAFGLPGCAEQSVLADTLDAASETDVAGLHAALAELFEKQSQARQHPFDQGLLVLDVDLSLCRQASMRKDRNAAIWVAHARRPGATEASADRDPPGQ